MYIHLMMFGGYAGAEGTAAPGRLDVAAGMYSPTHALTTEFSPRNLQHNPHHNPHHGSIVLSLQVFKGGKPVENILYGKMNGWNTCSNNGAVNIELNDGRWLAYDGQRTMFLKHWFWTFVRPFLAVFVLSFGRFWPFLNTNSHRYKTPDREQIVEMIQVRNEMID